MRQLVPSLLRVPQQRLLQNLRHTDITSRDCLDLAAALRHHLVREVWGRPQKDLDEQARLANLLERNLGHLDDVRDGHDDLPLRAASQVVLFDCRIHQVQQATKHYFTHLSIQ